jgi:hypothetical protein
MVLRNPDAMNMRRIVVGLGTTLALAGLLQSRPVPAGAIEANAVIRNVHYDCAFAPLFFASFPYSGLLVLNFNRGIITGTYTDTSIKPGSPFGNRLPHTVSGGADGSNIHLNIGAVWFNGIIQGDTISGSAMIRGRVYEFEAKERVAKAR